MSKNVSNQFKNIIKNGGPFYSYAVMTLANGTEIELTSENDFTVSENGYSESAESGFPLGEALSKVITLNLDNTVDTDTLQDTNSEDILDTQNDVIYTQKKSQSYDYYYARAVLYTEADLPDGTKERIQEGVFTVIDSVAPGDVLEITAYDDMYKADVDFTSTLSYPVSAQMLLNEVCDKCDITLGSATFRNNDFQIQEAPEGLTGRQVIGYIAQIAGGNAVIDRTGHLVIKTYDFSGFDVSEDVTAGEIETESGIHIISEYTSEPEIGTDDITITGVSTTIESEDSEQEDETYIVGSETYVLSIDNPLITGNEKEAVDLISDVVIGVTIRPFSGDFFPDPTVEFMDTAYLVDRKDNIYKTFITTHDFTYVGGSTFECGVESPERNGSSYYSTAAEAYQKAKNDINKNKTQWEQAIENLAQQVENASGLYTTEEEQSDGSTIFYMHNKPTLEESDIVWEMTAETLTVSTDGGETWNAGITVNGEVIARIMNTIGINFDWGIGGTLIIQDEDGNQTAYIDAETGVIRITGEFIQRSDNGALSVAITGNQTKYYDWENNGEYVGSVGAVKSHDSEGNWGINMWCDKGKTVCIGCATSDDNSDSNIKTVIRYDDDTGADDTPYIINTTSGTLFSANSGGGVTIENGQVKNYNINYGSGTLSVITGLSWANGSITRVERANITVGAGIIERWTTSTETYSASAASLAMTTQDALSGSSSGEIVSDSQTETPDTMNKDGKTITYEEYLGKYENSE